MKLTHPNVARRAVWASLVLGIVIGLVALARGLTTAVAPDAAAFAWLRPEAPPLDWSIAMTGPGAQLAYPPGWRAIRTDPGTASVAPAVGGGVFAGYLNATPASGRETLANWSRFRVAHLAAEGARRVRLETGSRVHFGAAGESCVIDTYSTSKTRFREIACIVSGARATTVVVAAAPVAKWTQKAAVLERAVASFAP
jgi:hypothetical protein